MQRPITRGAAAGAGLIFHIFAQDSTSTSGAGKASVGFASWACRFIRNGEAISGAITPEDLTTIGTYAAPTAATNIRIKAVDNTNMIGVYEIQIHLDWVNVTNLCQSLTIYLTATGVAVLPVQIPLEGVNRQDTVRMGLTALPNAAADAAGGLPISDAGGLDLDARLDAAVSSRLAPTVAGRTLDVSAAGEAGLDWANIGSPTTAQGLTGTTISTSQVVASVTGAVGSVTGAVGSVAAGGITTASFAAGAIDAAAIAANAIGASELAQDACQEIADELLNRNIAGGGSGGARIVRDAVRALRNRVAIAAGTATVYAEDDATPAWTAAVTTAAGNPVSEIDPA